MAKINYILVVLVFCVAYQIKAQVITSPTESDDILPPLITASGTGEIKVQPDQAEVDIGVQIQETTVQSLTSQLDSKSSAIIASLQSQGVAAKDIQTSYVNIQPNYPDNTDDSGNIAPNYYIGTKSMSFILRNLTNYDKIMTGLYQAGVNNVNGITFEVSDQVTPQIEAKKQAAANAKQIASAIASALGVKLGNVYSATDSSSGGGSPSPVVEFAMASDAAESSGPSISGGVVTFDADVTVSFYIDQ